MGEIPSSSIEIVCSLAEMGCGGLGGLTCTVHKLCVIMASLNEGADVCPTNVALVDCKEGFSGVRIVLSQKPLQVLKTFCTHSQTLESGVQALVTRQIRSPCCRSVFAEVPSTRIIPWQSVDLT